MSAQPEKRDVVVTRVFDAPVERVWKAWSDADEVMRWWGPDYFTSPSAKMDFREGGTSLVCMRAPESFGGQDMYSNWTYTVIVPMERIEYVHNLADQDGHRIDPSAIGMPPDFPEDVVSVVTFKPLDNERTEMTVTELDWALGQMRDMSELGLNQCMDKMGRTFDSD